MLKSLQHLKFAAFALLVLTAQGANADQLFTNWSGGIVGGALWSIGGPCAIGNCDAIEDNFSNQEPWVVTAFTVYIVTYPSVIADPHWRYALFTTAGDQIVAPTDTALTVTDLGAYSPYEIYKGVISGLNIGLPPGEYDLRFTNTQDQQVSPAYGVSTSPQTLSPGLILLNGSPAVEALLATVTYPETQEWAFEVAGTVDTIFKNGFEGP